MTTKKTTSPSQSLTVPTRQVERRIYIIREQNVMLDSDLAELYGVETKFLNRAVKRNIARFPEDFMFQLTAEDEESLRFQFGTSNAESQSVDSHLRSQSVISNAESETVDASLRSQLATSSKRRGGRRYLPYVFTEQGVAMLSSVLNSERAIEVNIQIMRAFVQMRRMSASHEELARKVDGLEKKYDKQFAAVFQAIKALMQPPATARRKIGFKTESKKG